MSAIPDQVKLPAAVAFEVVMQGIRIRLGRSVVTITGVVCGTAFLMSILTGQLVKKGVAEEDQRREEVSRMFNFIGAEMPNLAGRPVALLGSGTLSNIELRLMARVRRSGVGDILVVPGFSPAPDRVLGSVREIAVEDLGGEAAALLVLGDGQVPSLDWARILGDSLNLMVATTKSADELAAVPSVRRVQLSRKLSDEERRKGEADSRKEQFRQIWIIVISLLVTVIGISNAMLMSVTERFREIGTMKCLGALSAFITRLFILESSLMGLAGGIVGAVAGAVFATAVYTVTYGTGLVFSSIQIVPILIYALGTAVMGVVLSVIAALYPAKVASTMVPATALRSNV